MTKNILYIEDENPEFGWLYHVSADKYYKIVERTNHGFSENSFYRVVPENIEESDKNKLTSVSSEAVDLGFFIPITEEEYKVRRL